ncbi:MAG: protein kinase, partial [Candidatus Bathyarchaeia archaeon]
RKIVHRDVSPTNILFDNKGCAKLSDMGLAKSFELAGQSGITAPGETGGKILCIAPEQILDFCFVKPAADVYSVGVCLYFLLTARFPYHFPSPLDLLLGVAGLREVKHPFAIVLEDEPIPIIERKPDIPAPLAAVIDRCLRKNPEERFKDARELGGAIRKAIS